MAMDIYKLCMGTYQAGKLEVTGINSFKSFDLKYPYQYSDHTDPVANYSDKYAKDIPKDDTYMQLQRLRIADERPNTAQTRKYLGRKTFIDIKTNVKWRAVSFKQKELADVSDNNITNSTTIERMSEENIVEQASMVIGEYPYKAEMEQDVLDWLNVTNKTGNYSRMTKMK